MTSVDYKTKIYDIYMIKEDLGFTAEEKPKADCSGISVFSLGIAITTAAGSKRFSVCKYAWFLRIHSLILLSLLAHPQITRKSHYVLSFFLIVILHTNTRCLFLEHFLIQNIPQLSCVKQIHAWRESRVCGLITTG